MQAQAPDARCESGWHRFLTLYLPYAALACIAMQWPANGAWLGIDFSEMTWLRSIPSIDGYIRKSPFPSALAAYMALSGVLFLPRFLATLWRPELAYRDRSQVREAILKMRARPWLLLINGVVSIVFVWVAWVQPGYEMGLFPISARRGALAVAGPFFSFFTSTYMVLSMVHISVRFSFLAAEEQETPRGDGATDRASMLL